jgi:hypothetical protein
MYQFSKFHYWLISINQKKKAINLKAADFIMYKYRMHEARLKLFLFWFEKMVSERLLTQKLVNNKIPYKYQQDVNKNKLTINNR